MACLSFCVCLVSIQGMQLLTWELMPRVETLRSLHGCHSTGHTDHTWLKVCRWKERRVGNVSWLCVYGSFFLFLDDFTEKCFSSPLLCFTLLNSGFSKNSVRCECRDDDNDDKMFSFCTHWSFSCIWRDSAGISLTVWAFFPVILNHFYSDVMSLCNHEGA